MQLCANCTQARSVTGNNCDKHPLPLTLLYVYMKECGWAAGRTAACQQCSHCYSTSIMAPARKWGNCFFFFLWGQLNMVMGESEIGQMASDKCHEWGCCCTSTGWETPEGSMELAEIYRRACRSFHEGKGNLMGTLRRPQQICCSPGSWEKFLT